MLKFGALTDAWSREAPEEHVVLPVYEDDRLGGRAVLRYGVGKPGVQLTDKGGARRDPLVHYARILLYNSLEEADLVCQALNAAVRLGRRIDDSVIESAVIWMLGAVSGRATWPARPAVSCRVPDAP